MIENTLEIISQNQHKKFIWKSINLNKKNYINLEKLIKKKIKFKYEYYKFLHKISKIKLGSKTLREKTKFNNDHYLYDYSFTNESSIFQSPEIFSLIKVLYILKSNNFKKVKELRINLEDGYARKALKQISQNNNIKFTDFNQKKILTYNKYFLPWIIRSILLILNFIFINNFHFHKDKKILNQDVVISYINQPRLNKIKRKSFFWGEFEKIFNQVKKKKITWIYQDLINHKNKKDFKLMQKNNNEIFFKNYINFSTLVKSFFYFIKFNLKFSLIFFIYKKKIINELDGLDIYFINNLKKSLIGFNCFENILKINSIKKMAKEFKSNSNIFYLFENQSWEKILNKEIYGKRINCYGVVHSLLSKWDTRFHKNNLTKKCLPHKILINGSYNFKILKSFKKKMIKIESFRYNIFKNKKKKLTKHYDSINVYGSFDDVITSNLIKELSKSQFIKSNFLINFYPHPSSNFINSYNISLNIKKRRYGFLSLLPANSSIVIDKQLDKSNTAIFNYDNFHDYQNLIKNGLIFNNYNELETIIKKKLYKNQNLKKQLIYRSKNYVFFKNFLRTLND